MSAKQAKSADELLTDQQPGRSIKLNSKPTKSGEIEKEKERLRLEMEVLTEKATAIQQQEEAEKATARAQLKQQYDELLADARDYRQEAREARNEDERRQFFAEARSCEQAANSIASELGLNVSPDQERQIRDSAISSTKAIWIIISLFIGSALVTWLLKTVGTGAADGMAQTMLENAPSRALLAFTLTFATILAFIFFLWLLFPQIYRIWHNRIKTDRNLDSIIAESPGWAVLAFLLGLFYALTSLYAMFYTAMYT